MRTLRTHVSVGSFGIFRRLASLSELLQLFALQTRVSVVAFARALSSIPGYTSRELRYEGLTAVNVRDVGANLWCCVLASPFLAVRHWNSDSPARRSKKKLILT